MITATVDTNIFVSALLRDGPPRRCIEAAIEGKYILALSQPILDELRNVLLRRKFGFAPDYIDILLQDLISIAHLYYPPVGHGIVMRDPDDNIIVDCAVESRSAYIVTGDNDLLVLEKVKGIPVVTPAEFNNRRNR